MLSNKHAYNVSFQNSPSFLYIRHTTDEEYTDIQLEANHVPTFNEHARCTGKCHAKKFIWN